MRPHQLCTAALRYFSNHQIYIYIYISSFNILIVSKSTSHQESDCQRMHLPHLHVTRKSKLPYVVSNFRSWTDVHPKIHLIDLSWPPCFNLVWPNQLVADVSTPERTTTGMKPEKLQQSNHLCQPYADWRKFWKDVWARIGRKEAQRFAVLVALGSLRKQYSYQ